jgi:type II secretory pathway pseudopilin PulG
MGSALMRRGFTLVDVIVGCSLIALSLIFVLSALPTASARLLAARDKTVATHVAREQIEIARATSFDSLASSSPSAVTVTSVINGASQAVAYTPTVTVTSVSSSLKDVACTVTWRDRADGPLHQVVLETRFRKP